MRVVYLCEFGTLLGGERSLLVFLEQAREVLDPTVVCPSTGPLAERVRGMGVAVEYWPGSPKQLPTLHTLAEKWMEKKVDVVHANSLSMAAHAINLGARWKCAKVFHARDIFRLSARQWEILRSGVDGAIAVSEPVGAFLREGGIAAEKVHVIANGVTPPGDESRSALASRWARPVVACVGQIALRKGQDLFIEAACRLIEEGFAGTFVLMGERYSGKEESVQYERELRARTEAHDDRFVWAGYVADAAREMGGFDVLVIPSRQEPLSRVALEGLSQGVRVVATEVGGTREILDGGRLGWLTPAGDVAALERKIREAIKDEAKRELIRAGGPAWIRERYSPERQLAAILGIYRSVRRS